MKMIKALLFAFVILAATPSCKKCYTCNIQGVLPVCTCENGNDAGATYTGTVAQANIYGTACTQGGGYWYQTQAGTNASNNKYCYNTSGPLAGALNGQAAAESNEESNCENAGGTWLAD